MIYGPCILQGLVSVAGARFRKLVLFDKMRQVLARGKQGGLFKEGKKWDLGLWWAAVCVEECVPWCRGVCPAQQAMAPHLLPSPFFTTHSSKEKHCVAGHAAISHEKYWGWAQSSPKSLLIATKQCFSMWGEKTEQCPKLNCFEVDIHGMADGRQVEVHWDC